MIVKTVPIITSPKKSFLLSPIVMAVAAVVAAEVAAAEVAVAEVAVAVAAVVS